MLRRMLILIAVVLVLLCSYSGMSGTKMTAGACQEEAIRELEARWLSAHDDDIRSNQFSPTILSMFCPSPSSRGESNSPSCARILSPHVKPNILKT
jgi:hypothetical protein